MSDESSLLNDPEVLRELIMDHYQYPHNHELTKDAGYQSRHMASDSCIDDITVQSKIKDGVIQDIRFDGIACTISTASTSMMTDLLKGKSVKDLLEFHEVVDLTIEDNHNRLVFGNHRLGTGVTQIKNGKSAESKGNGILVTIAMDPVPFHIRSSVPDALRHLLNHIFTAIIHARKTCKTTHTGNLLL